MNNSEEFTNNEIDQNVSSESSQHDVNSFAFNDSEKIFDNNSLDNDSNIPDVNVAKESVNIPVNNSVHMSNNNINDIVRDVNANNLPGNNNNLQNKQEATEIGNKIKDRRRNNMQDSTSRPSSIDDDSKGSNNQGLEDKSGNKLGNSDKKDIAKNIGKNIGNSALNSASNSDNDLVRGTAKTVKAGKKVADTVKSTKKIISNIKNFSAIASKLASVISSLLPILVYVVIGIVIIVLVICIYQVIVSSLSFMFGFTGEESYEVFNEKYEENMSTSEIEDIADDVSDEERKLCELSGWGKVRDFFNLEDTEDSCELSHYVDERLKEKEKPDSEDQIGINALAPGYLYATLYYAYDSQNVDENGEMFLKPDIDSNEDPDVARVLSDLDIVSLLFAKGVRIYDKDDIKVLLDQNVVDVKYEYYVWETEDEEPTEDSEYKCVTKEKHEYAVSNEKFKLYLRLGEKVSKAYEEDLGLSRTYNMTSEECIDKLKDFDKKPDLNKYREFYEDIELDVTSDVPSLTIDGKTYDYSDGFIYKTYPRYNPKYTINNAETPMSALTAMDIEEIISNIDSRQDNFNYLLGYPNGIESTLLKPSVSKICKYNVGGEEVSNIYIKLLHGNAFSGIDVGAPIEGQELIPLEDFIMGVIYSGSDSLNSEAIKSKAIVLRNQILNKEIKYENDTNIIEIYNSSIVNGISNNLTYCDIVKGCSIIESNGNKSYYTVGTEPSSATIISGKSALSEENNIKNAVSSVAGVTLLDDSKNIVNITYDSNAENRFNSEGISKDYVEILVSYYGGIYDVSESKCAIGDWIWPTVEPFKITECFGDRIHPVYGTPDYHGAVDIAGYKAIHGSPIYAASDGQVAFIGNNPNSSAGINVMIKHDDTFSSRYLHLSRTEITLQVGDEVKAGQVIGYMGNTGVGTGSHLHFVILQNGNAINPLQIFGEDYNINNTCPL